MDQAQSLADIKKSCASFSGELMRLTPAINGVNDPGARDELFKAVFQLTKDVEAVKKLVRKIETAESTPLT